MNARSVAAPPRWTWNAAIDLLTVLRKQPAQPFGLDRREERRG